MSYGLQSATANVQQGLGAYNSAIGQCAQEAAPEPVLHRLLHRLYSIRESLGAAASRELQLAERLLGSEPSALNKANDPKEAVEPPLVYRLERAIDDLAQLSETIHHHLNRLERL